MYQLDFSGFKISEISNLQVMLTFLLIIVYITIKFILKHKVEIYNKNYDGALKYIGSGYIKVEEFGYEVNITKRMLLNSYTNEYIIVTNDFIIGRNYSYKVAVKALNKVVVVDLDDEMEVVF